MVKYPDYGVELFAKGVDGSETLRQEKAKEILGWQEESENVKFGDNYLFKDRRGKKIRLAYNDTNRPFDPQLAHDWMMAILRKQWRLNGESIIVDRLGKVQDGQHRLIGLVFAVQEWELRKETWREYWTTTPYIETVVVCGIAETDDVVNTIGTGKPRNLTDVMFRGTHFRDVKPKARKRLAKVAAHALKLLWLRTGADMDTLHISRRAHSDSTAFFMRHEKLVEAIKFVVNADEGKRLSRYLPLGYAATLLYLMACAQSDRDTYVESNDGDPDETTLDWELWDRAADFLELLPEAEHLKPLRAVLDKVEAGGKLGRDERCGYVVLAWNMLVDGKPVKGDGLVLTKVQDELGRTEVADIPLIGGIDVGTYRAVGGDEAEEEAA